MTGTVQNYTQISDPLIIFDHLCGVKTYQKIESMRWAYNILLASICFEVRSWQMLHRKSLGLSGMFAKDCWIFHLAEGLAVNV